VSKTQDEVDEFVMHFTTGAWSKLCGLNLRGFTVSDEQLARMIEGMQKVLMLDLPGCAFGQLSLKALHRHFPYVRHLNIFYTGAPTSSMVLEILASCPRLEFLITDVIMSQDLLDSPTWACEHSMKTLEASFRITPDKDSDDHQRRVLGRLSRLVNLESLCLHNFHTQGDTKFLDLRVEKGLDQLATLKRLKDLIVHNYAQELTAIDIEVPNPVGVCSTL
jgi:hypothetical protein